MNSGDLQKMSPPSDLYHSDPVDQVVISVAVCSRWCGTITDLSALTVPDTTAGLIGT